MSPLPVDDESFPAPCLYTSLSPKDQWVTGYIWYPQIFDYRQNVKASYH